MIESTHNITQARMGVNRQLSDTAKVAVNPSRLRSTKNTFTQKVGENIDQINFSRLESANNSLNNAAKKIGAADAALNKINNNASEIKNQLTNIVNTYPPLPAGSEEREKIFNKIDQHQKQINDLTNLKETAEKIKMTDSSVGTKSGVLSIKIDETNHPYTIRSYAVAEIQKHVDSITRQSSDIQLTDSRQNLEDSMKNLTKEQNNLKKEISQLADTKILSKVLPGFKFINIDGNMADQLSTKIGHSLGIESNSITGGDGRFTELLV